jgi:hypothetical protein
MNRYRTLIPFILISIFFACAYPLVEFNIKYEKRDLSSDYLLVFPVAEHMLFLNNRADITKAFNLGNADPLRAILDSLNAYLQSEVSANIRQIRLVKGIAPSAICPPRECGNYFSVDLTLKLQNIEYEYKIPKSVYIDSLSGETDFILVLDRVAISRLSEYQGQEPRYSKGSDSIQSLVNFVLWDYNADRAVSYGSVQTLTHFAFEPSLADWQSHFKDIIRNIFNQTPINYLETGL